jgi:hypothetical protein
LPTNAPERAAGVDERLRRTVFPSEAGSRRIRRRFNRRAFHPH